MDRRFEVRKQEMLAECEVSPQVFRGVEERMETFVQPFADLLRLQAQREHAADYLSGLVSDLQKKNVESIAYRHDQNRRNLQHFIGTAEWDHQPLFTELARQVGQKIGEADGVIVFDPSAFLAVQRLAVTWPHGYAVGGQEPRSRNSALFSASTGRTASRISFAMRRIDRKNRTPGNKRQGRSKLPLA